jgi:adenine-specific DNA-methyltransferase
MAKRATKKKAKKQVEALRHQEATRTNIPTAELQSVMDGQQKCPSQVTYERRNRDLDPQLVWRGKFGPEGDDPSASRQDWSAPLVVQAPPLYIQEKVKPKVLIDDLLRRTEAQEKQADPQMDLFADFNGLPEAARSTEFYQHEANWTNRMILGDSLQVMASLAEREGLRGKVQCIYLDPPYGIKFNSNFQWSTTSRTVVDGKGEHITREPEQVKAFRDTWRDGIHSYLTYLRDRLVVARDLLHESGSIFVQIGDENVHRVQAILDEVFGESNNCAMLTVVKTAGQSSELIAGTADYVLWYAKSKPNVKFRNPLLEKTLESDKAGVYRWIREDDGSFRPLSDSERLQGRTERVCRYDNFTSQRPPGSFPIQLNGRNFGPGKGYWKTGEIGVERLLNASRIRAAKNSLTYIRMLDDFPAMALGSVWSDTATGSFTDEKIYVVQSGTKLVQRCVLMTTDPGDLVLDPTCGSGTTAYVAEQWGRRWITIDTSRVALALARARIMGARYPFYLLADSKAGQQKEAEVSRSAPIDADTHGNIQHGFVYERVPHVTLKSIANNAEIDVIWQQYQEKLEPLREQLNRALKQTWQEWEIPREAPSDNDKDAWSKEAKKLHAQWWKQRIARQQEIDASIAAKADSEFLYDKPYEDKKKVRVAGPFTVESVSPHRVLSVDEDDELIDPLAQSTAATGDEAGFVEMILDNLRTAGVQQAHKEDKTEFTSIAPWPGHFVCAEGHYNEGADDQSTEKRAGIFIGPEFGTVSREDLVRAARECGDAGFDVLISCAFNYEAHASEFDKLGRVPVLKARMNADLHMAGDLKNTGKGNLFVIFGEPDIDILDVEDGKIQVKINGVDVFHPNTGEVRSDGAEGIACWFIDTDYNEESFFVRQAYFLGANDPYKSLKTTLKAEINEDAWSTLNSDTSRPFEKPPRGRIAVKVINHLGDEVMKVFRVYSGI